MIANSLKQHQLLIKLTLENIKSKTLEIKSCRSTTRHTRYNIGLSLQLKAVFRSSFIIVIIWYHKSNVEGSYNAVAKWELLQNHFRRWWEVKRRLITWSVRAQLLLKPATNKIDDNKKTTVEINFKTQHHLPDESIEDDFVSIVVERQVFVMRTRRRKWVMPNAANQLTKRDAFTLLP